MYHYLIPTAKNNYRARILRTPVLVVMAIAVFLFNTIAGFLPVEKVHAAISTQQLLELHNQERQRAGLQALKINPALTNSAQAKAQAMLDADCWSHYCPAGKSPWDFFTTSGYNYLYAGENLAEGFFDNEDVMIAWMNSPTHRENVIKPEYSEVGFGVIIGKFQGKESNVVLVVHFGTPQPVRNIQQTNQETGLARPEITHPQDGSAINTREVDIEGTALGADSIELHRNGARWVTADANQGIFTYRASDLTEQRYEIAAISHSGEEFSSPSDSVTFEVDLSPDSITASQILIAKRNDKNELQIHVTAANLSQVYILIGDKRSEFQPTNDNLWVGTITLADLQSNKQFTIGNIDRAGNEWSTDMDSGAVLGQAEKLPIDASEVPDGGRVISNSTKAQVNAIFLIILILLFAADFLVLGNSGVTRQSFKTHLHFAVFVVVALIALTGIISGQVGIGLSSVT